MSLHVPIDHDKLSADTRVALISSTWGIIAIFAALGAAIHALGLGHGDLREPQKRRS